MVKKKQYPLEIVNELKKMFPENLEFHTDLQNSSPAAWIFVSKEVEIASKNLDNAIARLKKLGRLFGLLSDCGFPGT